MKSFKIHLVFPPLVNTNFGNYYPSTAVLAGYLEHKGQSTTQTDLNEGFALFLLQDEILEYLLMLPPIERLDNIFFKACILTLRDRRKELFNVQGQHLFNDDSNPMSRILERVSREFLMDIPIGYIKDIDKIFSDPLFSLYDKFFSEENAITSTDKSIELVGISVPMGPQLLPTIRLVSYIKRQLPDCRIILGGPTFSLMPEEDIEALLRMQPSIDAIVRYDGEHAIAEISQQILEGIWMPDLIANVSSLIDDRIHHIAPKSGPRLNDLPYPNYEMNILNKLANPELAILQARGCYWGKCTYCDFVELYEGSQMYRTRTPASFIKELQSHQNKYGISSFCLITESIPPAFAKKISELILEKGIDVKWNSFAMVHDKFDVELLTLMKNAGCEYLVVGLESMNSRVLKLTQKKADRIENIKFLANAGKAGLKLKVNLIPNLPTTTYEEALEDLDILSKFQDVFHSIAIFPFEATRSSEIGKNPELYGLKVEQKYIPAQAQYSNNHLEIIDDSMSDGQKHEILDKFRSFAAAVNKKNCSYHELEDQSTTDTYELDEKNISLIEYNETTYYLNILSGELFLLPKGWRQLINKVRIAQPLTVTEFRNLFPMETADYFFSQLLSSKIIRPK